MDIKIRRPNFANIMFLPKLSIIDDTNSYSGRLVFNFVFTYWTGTRSFYLNSLKVREVTMPIVCNFNPKNIHCNDIGNRFELWFRGFFFSLKFNSLIYVYGDMPFKILAMIQTESRIFYNCVREAVNHRRNNLSPKLKIVSV